MRGFTKQITIVSSDSVSLKKYLRDIDKFPLLTVDEEYEYSLRVKQGDITAKRILVECNLRFVVSVAKQSLDKNCTLEDLINEGNIGLIQSIDKYDPTQGFKFISYAVWWIRQKINEYKNENSRLIRIPANKINQLSKFNLSIKNLEQTLNRTPNINEIADHMGISIKLANKINNVGLFFMTSLDKPSEVDDNVSLHDIIPATSDGYIDKNGINDKEVMLDKLLSNLKPRDKEIIKMCYGINHTQMTLEEIGEVYNISREAIRLIRDKSISRLGSFINSYEFDDVLIN